jgi:subtilisin-like proprotein convertase family protein
MKRLFRALTSILALLTLGGWLPPAGPTPVAHAEDDTPGPIGSSAVRFGVSSAVNDLPLADTFELPQLSQEDSSDAARARDFAAETIDAEAPFTDSLLLESAATPSALPGPILSFDGLSSQDDASVGFVGVLPPDTVGDVGPSHYVQMVNSTFRIWDKTGHPLVPVRRLSDLFAPLGSPCGTRNDGHPTVLYDPLADRWLLSQTCLASTPNDHQLIAVSQTGDPTGAYFLYDFMMPNSKVNDRPKLGVWPSAYLMANNQLSLLGLFRGAGAFAFDRVKMLAGDPSTSYVYFDLAATPSTATVTGMLPADLDGLTPPPPGTPGYFASFTADESGDPADALRVFELRPDFANPAASTFTERPESPIAVAAFDPRNPVGRNDIEQPSPGVRLDSVQDRLMHRLAYRNFGDHEALVLNHTVNVGPSPALASGHQAAVRYYELRRTGGAFGVAEQATFAPDATNRWMASAAQDHAGDVAVAYSASSASTAPSIRYAGRQPFDPPGLSAETTLVAGTGVQTHSSGRWGEYSALGVDPADDCTFWYTNEYYTAASQSASPAGWLTRVGTFKFPSCAPGGLGTIQGVVTNAVTGLPIAGAAVRTAAGYTRITDGSGRYSMTVAPASQDLTASKPVYANGVASGVVVADGGATTQDFALTPLPILMSSGASLVASESCDPATGAIDPGETVSVELSIQNGGIGDTAHLVGTLLPTGGVIAPGPAQTYGVVTAGGPSVARTFSFTADPDRPCGSPLIATLSLEDGAFTLGTVSYTLRLGALSNGGVAVTYGTGDVAVPIPDAGTVEVPVGVADLGPDPITDVKVRVRLNHTFASDLVISLVHPDGTVVPLSANRGDAGDNFGGGPNDCSGRPTVFDDGAAVAIGSGTPPFAGSFRPESPLSVLSGRPASGTWKLRVSDTAEFDSGTIGCVQLEISRRTSVCCPFAGGVAAVGAAPPATVTAESCGPVNGAPDPDETVTVSFPLQNIGTGPTVNLVATLLPGGGVNAPSGPQSYGALSPVGSPVARPFSFIPSGSCGGTLTATLALVDEGGAGPIGTATFTLDMGVTPSATFTNPAPVKIPAIGTGASTGARAAPYPSTIDVSGISGTVSSVRVTLNRFSHAFPADVDVLLVGPGGQKVLLMSDVSAAAAAEATITFDDAASPMAAVVSGTFAATNVDSGDVFPASAPSGPYPDPPRLAVFNGVDPNGTWSLFVVDDSTGETGSIAGGWSLRIATEPVCCDQPCSLACPAGLDETNDPGQCSAAATFASPGTAGNCGTVACAPPSGSVLPVGSTADVCTATRSSDGATTSCTFDVAVRDVESPLIACPASLSVGSDAGACSALVNPGTADASDNCPGARVGGVRSDGQPLSNAYPVGTTSIAWTATDAAGADASCVEMVTVADAEPPTVTGLSATPAVLWPPNHQMADVTVAYGARDNCGAVTTTLTVSSNEPIDGTGDGDTAPDWQVVDDHHVRLRAERSGHGSGRIYTIAVTAKDSRGGTTTRTVSVWVPHDKR